MQVAHSLLRVYALDVTSIDLCLRVFEWAPSIEKAAAELHTLLDLQSATPPLFT